MRDYKYLKPRKRSRLRSIIGKMYYQYARYLKWQFSDTKFADDIQKDLLEHPIADHKTPLYRKLKDVDMWLQENKVINLSIAIKHINGMIIRPGETFSYWKTIGKPTAKKGYVEGMVLHYGKFKPGVGGGLCQLSNMLYWMVLHTPLTVTERHRHAFDCFPDVKRNQPFGSGATCVYNYRDLQFKNNTDETYQIKLSIEGSYLKGAILSDREACFKYKIYEKNHEMLLANFGSYIRHNVIHRQIFNEEGFFLQDEFVTENNALMMYEPLLEYEEKAEHVR